MAVPKKKRSKSKSGKINSHSALKKVNISFDKNGDVHLSHRATKLPDGELKYNERVICEKSPVKSEKAAKKKVDKN